MPDTQTEPKPVTWITTRCSRCLHRILARDIPPGLDAYDIAAKCEDDPLCPKTIKKVPFAKATIRFKILPHAWAVQVRVMTGKKKPKLKSKWSLCKAFSESNGKALFELLKQLALTGGQKTVEAYVSRGAKKKAKVKKRKS